MGISKNQGHLIWTQNNGMRHIGTPTSDPQFLETAIFVIRGKSLEAARAKECSNRGNTVDATNPTSASIYYATMTPRFSVYKVMRDLYHQQYVRLSWDDYATFFPGPRADPEKKHSNPVRSP